MQLGKCSEFQAFTGHCLKCTVTGVHHYVSGHGQSGDTSIVVKLIRKGLQSKKCMGMADSVQQCQVVLGNKGWLKLNGF